ncbi:hypothetical protein [Novosphingobium sp.]|uniref:hypothetical protein n=1 Tax=Novosphingobium sp. TaxID=1874826 RepID=UPI0031E27010
MNYPERTPRQLEPSWCAAVAAIALGCLTGGVIVGVVQGDGREIESQTLFAIPWAALGLGLFGWPLSRALGHWYARSWLALAAPLIGALAGAIMAFPMLDMIGMCPVGRTCWRGELPAALQIGALFGAPTGFWWWFFYRRVLIRRAASQN